MVPLVVAAWTLLTTLGGGALVVIGNSEGKRLINNYSDTLIPAFFAQTGMVVDEEHPLSDESLTLAINEAFLKGSGLKIESLFDRQKMLKGFEKLAISKASTAFGLEPTESEAGFRETIQQWLTAEVIQQMQAEAGEIFVASKEAINIKRVLAKGVKLVGWNEPIDFTEHGIKNRERQARYRATHKRSWVDKVATS